MANPHLINFIQGLSPVEIRLVEDHLNKTQALFDHNNKDGLMEIKLFKYIVANKKENITDDLIASETGTKRVSDLKNNLFSKVLESLTLDKYITNSSLFNENDSIHFILKKKLLACRISIRSISEGKTETIDELLNDIIAKAKEFELYEVLIEALHVKKYFRGIRAGLQAFEKINDELPFYEYCHKASVNANDNYYRLILNNDFIKTLSNSEADKHLNKSIKEMELDYKKTKSEQINYYLHILRFALAERQKDYEAAIGYCNKLIAMLKKHKSIYRNERMGFVYTNLVQYKTFLGKYADALKDARKSQSYYLEDSFNLAVAKEQEFYTNFYNEDYRQANVCLNFILNHSSIDTGEFRKSKFIYYQACVLFAEKNHTGALRLLNESLEIEKDKTRWNISLRILNIMIYIEKDKIDEAVASLESLRKYMERTGKTDEVSERNVMIVKLLRELEKNGFKYDPKNAGAKKMLEQLSEKNTATSWEHYSSELIKFHQWLENRS
ncbi:MAG: hypothetical protein JWP12_72 [Bacteroidetes bacterium]|nr:hypothetical protein [Bacteroidota bacterium]